MRWLLQHLPRRARQHRRTHDLPASLAESGGQGHREPDGSDSLGFEIPSEVRLNCQLLVSHACLSEAFHRLVRGARREAGDHQLGGRWSLILAAEHHGLI